MFIQSQYSLILYLYIFQIHENQLIMSEEEKGEGSKGDDGGGGENSKLEKLTSAISNKIEQMESEFKKVCNRHLSRIC